VPKPLAIFVSPDISVFVEIAQFESQLYFKQILNVIHLLLRRMSRCVSIVSVNYKMKTTLPPEKTVGNHGATKKRSVSRCLRRARNGSRLGV